MASLSNDTKILFKNQDHTGFIHPWRNALILSAVYIIAAGVYIIASSHLAAQQALSIEELRLTELHKGLIFVSVTGLGLFIFSGIQYRRLLNKEKKIVRQRYAILKSERYAVAGLLSSSIGHDINNVLSVLNINLDHLNERFKQDVAVSQRLTKIGEATDRLITLSQNLRDAGRFKQDIEKQSINLYKTIADAIDFSRTHKAVRACNIQLTCPKHLTLNASPPLIQQMFFNLILNSAEATGGRGSIHIIIEGRESNVHIKFEDDGPGISEKDQQKIFQPFYTTKLTGTGLGMLSIKACLESHQGTISVYKGTKGGAGFHLTFPAEESIAQPDSQPVSSNIAE
ncbi:MAG: hypothetical protein GF313_05685 [Caldithrix sp.]|nr:hypothetical protein [Caldithrix sp.]